jgi:hypothetical protein
MLRAALKAALKHINRAGYAEMTATIRSEPGSTTTIWSPTMK